MKSRLFFIEGIKPQEFKNGEDAEYILKKGDNIPEGKKPGDKIKGKVVKIDNDKAVVQWSDIKETDSNFPVNELDKKESKQQILEYYADDLFHKFKDKYYLIQADYFKKIKDLFHIKNENNFVKLVLQLGKYWYELINNLSVNDEIDEYGFPTFRTFFNYVKNKKLDINESATKAVYKIFMIESRNYTSKIKFESHEVYNEIKIKGEEVREKYGECDLDVMFKYLMDKIYNSEIELFNDNKFIINIINKEYYKDLKYVQAAMLFIEDEVGSVKQFLKNNDYILYYLANKKNFFHQGVENEKIY